MLKDIKISLEYDFDLEAELESMERNTYVGYREYLTLRGCSERCWERLEFLKRRGEAYGQNHAMCTAQFWLYVSKSTQYWPLGTLGAGVQKDAWVISESGPAISEQDLYAYWNSSVTLNMLIREYSRHLAGVNEFERFHFLIQGDLSAATNKLGEYANKCGVCRPKELSHRLFRKSLNTEIVTPKPRKIFLSDAEDTQ